MEQLMSRVVIGPEREIPFEIIVDDSISRIVFCERVCALAFFHHGYILQKMCECGQYQGTRISRIIVDLSSTTWFDTLALCYLVMFLVDGKDKCGTTVGFIDTHDDAFDSFLVENGFKRYFKILCGETEYVTENNTIKYSNIHECSYPLYIFDQSDEIETLVSIIIEKTENEYKAIMEPQKLMYLLNKLSYYLHETMQNVFEHAYEDNTGKCGLLIKKVDCNKVEDIRRYRRSYLSQTPYVAARIFEDLSKYLEVYVFDTGIGLRRSFFPDPDGADKNKSDDDLIKYIFTEGQRSYKKLGKFTHFGGLSDIHRLITKDRDGLGIKADSTWSFSYERNKDPQPINTEEMHGHYDKLIHGFALVASFNLDAVEKKEYTDTNEEIPEENLRKIFSSDDDSIYKNLPRYLNCISDYRKGFIKDKKQAVHETEVIYIGNYFNKNQIVKIIYESQSENIIILGIQEAEIKKYKTIIQNITSYKASLRKIIVTTQSLTVFCFVPKNGHYVISEDIKKKYLSSLDCDNIENSYIALLLLDKLYNSTCMWEMIDRMDNSVYINKVVKWDEIPLRGYLDFSQVCRIPECKKLCIETLVKLKILHKNIYFNSIDRFADEICEKANHMIEAHEDDKKINIGSVFVSGTSNRLFGESLDAYYFFCHPDSTDKKIRSLLKWADKQPWIDSHFSQSGDNEHFERLGYSSFISKEGSKYLLEKHYREFYNQYPLHLNDIYEVLQRKIGVQPATIKFGHFECLERHDLFGYRINYMFDADRVGRQVSAEYDAKSIFDFLFTSFVISICGMQGTESTDNILSKGLSGGIEKALNIKISKVRNDNVQKHYGIIVYLSDFQTAYLAEKIEEYLNRDLTKRIIPLLSISRDYDMGSLIVSPLVLDRIENQIKELKKINDEVVVTVFVSTAFNVRLLEEIKQILYGIGASKVKVLSVLDRRRISMLETRPAIKSFGRIDTYSLDTGEKCALCRAIEVLSNCSEKINDETIFNRIDNIIKRWKCIKISDVDFEKGLDVNSIILTGNTYKRLFDKFRGYLNRNLRVNTDVAFASLIMEYTTVTSSVDLLIELLKDERIIEENVKNSITSDELKILLSCSYLLFFLRSPISFKQAKNIALILCNLLDKQKKTTHYTALAVLTISSLPKRFKKNVLENYEKEILNHYGKSLPSHNSCCLDAVISRIILFLEVGDIDTEPELECYVRCYLKNQESKLECLYEAFMFVETVYNQSHSRAYAIIKDANKVGFEIYSDALRYTNKLKSYISEKGTYLLLYRDKNRINDQKDALLCKLDDTIKSLERLLKLQNKDNSDFQINVADNDDARIVKINVCEYIEKLQSIQSKGLYLRTPRTRDDKIVIEEWLEYCKKEACNRTHHKPSEIDIDYLIYSINMEVVAKNPEAVRPWFYSFFDVTEETINLFVDIILNMSGKVINKLRLNDSSEHDGIVVVKFESKFAAFHFINATNNTMSIDEIRARKESKEDRITLHVFKEFERRINIGMDTEENYIHCFEYDYPEQIRDFSEHNKIFEATMRVPYINRGSKGLSTL